MQDCNTLEHYAMAMDHSARRQILKLLNHVRHFIFVTCAISIYYWPSLRARNSPSRVCLLYCWQESTLEQ
jgi:hypothetical protein